MSQDFVYSGICKGISRIGVSLLNGVLLVSDAIVPLRNEEVIFSMIFSQDEDVLRCKQDLLTTFSTSNVFKDEFAVFFAITKDIPKVVPNKEFILLYLQTNRAIFLKSSNIDFDRFKVGDSGDSENYVEFVNSCLSLFESCSARKVSSQDFYRAVEMHKMLHITKESIQILTDATTVLSDGVKRGPKTLTGYGDMRKLLKQGFIALDNMVSKTDRRGTITYGYNDLGDQDDDSLKLVSTFGLRELDDHVGGIYEGDMVSLLAPSKGGKSRLSTYIVHNAIVNHGTNVVMWSVENGYKGWEALLRARHFNYFYNSGITDASKKRLINSDMIRKKEMSAEMAEMEAASWMDLRCNTNYGRITSIDEDFNSDTLFEVLDGAISEFGAKLICVDYLQLISSGGDSDMVKNERISEVYKKMLQYVKKKKIGGLFPAQLKQAFVDEMQRKSPEELVNMEMRSAAGESYEVIKTPDVNLLLYGTAEDIATGNMQLFSVPSRNIGHFEPIQLYADAGSCTFQSIPKSA